MSQSSSSAGAASGSSGGGGGSGPHFLLKADIFEYPYPESTSHKDLKRSRNYFGVLCVFLFGLSLLLYGILLTVENDARPAFTVSEDVDLHSLPPIQLTGTCTLTDVDGKINTVCGKSTGTFSPNGPVYIQDLTTFASFSYLTSTFADSTVCTGQIPFATQSSTTADLYNVDLQAWLGSGATSSQSYSSAISTSCNASMNGAASLPARRLVQSRVLGPLPLCPFEQIKSSGALDAETPVAGLGFVVPAASDSWSLAWGRGDCGGSFAFSIEASVAHNISTPIPLVIRPSDQIMEEVLSQGQRWSRSPNFRQRLPLLQYEITLSQAWSLAGKATTSARVVQTSTFLSPTRSEPVMGDTDDLCVGMEQCGYGYKLAADQWARFSTQASAIAASQAARLSQFASTNRTAQLALFHALRYYGIAPSNATLAELYQDSYKFTTSSTLSSAARAAGGMVLLNNISDFVPRDLAAYLSASYTTDQRASCLSTAQTRMSWQKATTGCSLDCSDVIPSTSRALLALPVTDATGFPRYVVYLQRGQDSITCANMSSTQFLSAYPSWTTSGHFGLVDRETVALERGPMYATGVVFRTSPTMRVTRQISTRQSTLSVISTALGMFGVFQAAFFVAKRLLDDKKRRICSRKKKLATAGADSPSAEQKIGAADEGAAAKKAESAGFSPTPVPTAARQTTNAMWKH